MKTAAEPIIRRISLSLSLSSAASASRRLFSVSTSLELSSTAESKEEEKKKKMTKVEPLYRRLSALGGAPEANVSKALNKWIREGRSVTSVHLIKYVKDLRKYKRYCHALEVMDWMVKARGMNLSYPNHAIRLDLISKVKGIKAAEDYFSALPDPAKNERTYGALLNSYCSEKMADEALALYEKMKELNFASRTLVHNNIMSLYMKLQRPEKVHTQFREMKANNISPDNLTYCILMSSYAALKDIDSVERVITEMEEDEEVIVQWPAYSTLAAIYNSASLHEKAESALKKLEKLINTRDREPFHFLVTLYAGARNLEEVHRVWKSLRSTFIKQTNMSYLTMLLALNKLDDFEGLKSIYKEWVSVHEMYDVRLTNVVCSAYLKREMYEEAESLYLEEGCHDSRACDLFIDYCLKKGEMGSALKWAEVAGQVGKWRVDAEKVSLFLKHFEVEKDVDGLEKLCKVLKKIGRMSVSAYESLIRTYAAAGMVNSSLGERVKEDGLVLGPESKRMLERVCGSEKND